MSSLFGAKYLAVLDLDPVGFSDMEAEILTQRLIAPPMKILLLILIAFCLLAYTWKYRKSCIENVDDQEKPLDGTS